MNITEQVHIEDENISLRHKEVEGTQVLIEGETYYKISNVDEIRPFFMSIVSASNHWMFIASNGGVTAGRQNAEFSLFPYYTDDKVTESADVTGSKTIFHVRKDNVLNVWEPFSERYEGKYTITRNLYKNNYGNKVLFEEINHDLELVFSYQWSSSDVYGFVRQSKVSNIGPNSVSIEMLDGIQNVLPYGVGSDLQNASSNLVDAYKRSELHKKSGLGIFALSAIIVDKAEPSEALKANIVWSVGLDNPKYLMSSKQLKNYRRNKSIIEETDIKAEKGAYFVNTTVQLTPNAAKEWFVVANVNQNHAEVIQLTESIQSDIHLLEKVKKDINQGTKELIKLNAAADGLQFSADQLRDTRHFANSLFNIMRGGIFDDNYTIEKRDFKVYIDKANKKVARKNEVILEKLPKQFSLFNLHSLALKSEDKNFRRLCLEYMPLKFSRRHGDPSRPWNKFSINTRNEDGSKKLDYEGNWRDIFQNWEALAYSYPAFIESMMHKFLNATTFDGYNPYRVTKDGFDWEIIEPDDSWSYIGYWGDHQIIYLLKFLEFIEKHQPKRLESFFNKNLFVYANVPYRIKPYEDLLKNPKDTIVFDEKADSRIRQERIELGADGALLRDENRFIIKVNFVEKILATTLAKMSNFIPEGGIWMNTQRPEWNDANNALVGNGVSMVTLYYLRRFFSFFKDVFEKVEVTTVEISKELITFYNETLEALEEYKNLLSDQFTNKQRKQVLDALGQSASNYRLHIYNTSFSGRKEKLSVASLKSFINISLEYLEHSIQANKRSDNLYHAYNLMTLENENEISISYLDEMLEGQVAVLSSEYLTSLETLKLLDSMKRSKLFREDQYSYLLYPNKELKGFVERNSIPKESVERSTVLQTLMDVGDTSIIEKDVLGGFHFNGNFKNANDLDIAMDNFSLEISEKDKNEVFRIFEEVFNHKAFTGRSGTFYGYEGLGSIYWHMVSKLQLAVQECCLKTIREKESVEITGRLLEHYYEINEGIGVHKPPALYGAFPTDPYSHTPAGKGAQQPGMTGQVKEDVLSRFGELGVFVSDGRLYFNPFLLRKNEFITETKVVKYVSVKGNETELQLPQKSLLFTYCQVPIMYIISQTEHIEILYSDGNFETIKDLTLTKQISNEIFNRTNRVVQLNVFIKEASLK